MITAAEAARRTESSNAALNNMCEIIGEKITEAADLGKRKLILQDVIYNEPKFEVIKPPYHEASLTPWQRLLAAKLKDVGYAVDIVTREVTVGGGFKSMDSESTTEQRHVIRVSW